VVPSKASSVESCQGYLPVDSRNVLPTVDVSPGPTVVFLFVMNYSAVSQVVTAFQPDPDWTFAFGLWDCQPGPVPIVVPAPPFGPVTGTAAGRAVAPGQGDAAGSWGSQRPGGYSMNSALEPRAALVAGLLVTCVATAASAGLNPNFTLPLHAKASSFEPCSGYLPVDCTNHLPVVNIAPGPTAVFLFVMSHAEVAGVQTAFQPDESWIFVFGLWNCRDGQLNAVTPAPPFGPAAGTIATAFNCVTGSSLAVVGRIFFIAGSNGCLEQIQSSYPFGIWAST